MTEIPFQKKEFWASVAFSLAIIIVSWVAGIVITFLIINIWWSLGGSFTALGLLIDVIIIIVVVIVVILSIMGSYAAYIKLLNWYYAMFCRAKLRYQHKDEIKELKKKHAREIESWKKHVKELEQQNKVLYGNNQKLLRSLNEIYGLKGEK
ncbi:MAG: hypothetical protein DRI44_05735 [Chlamydiae bacterium]|nr:MAG: hypothetical protein DRI44_05735 [Chlamydiota bacterium]